MANTADQARSEGLVGQATSQVQDAASTAQDKAVELKERGKSRLGEQLDQRTTDAGSQARTMARALRRSGEQMRTEGEPRAAGLAETASDRIEQLGSYLERTSGDQLLHDVEDFARRRPWVVAGAGLLAGLVASRFLKASSERRYASSQSAFPYRPAAGEEWSGPYGRPADEPVTRQGYGSTAG
jgi:ElaB/YqjD/DUF883 family membrane-anchored ribosome-binding protein